MKAKPLASPLLFLLVTLVLTFPAVLHLDEAFIGDGGDTYQFVGFQYLAHRLTEQGTFPYLAHTDYWRYPSGVDFQNVSDGALYVLIGLSIYPFLRDPVTVHNITLLSLLFLNLWLAFVFFRLLFKPSIAIAGAVMFGASFYTLARLGGHASLVLTSSYSFVLYSGVVLFRQEGSVRGFVLLTLSVLAVALSSLQHVLILVGSFPVILIVMTAFFPSTAKAIILLLSRQRWRAICALFTITNIFLLFYGEKTMSVLDGSIILPIPEFISVPFNNYLVPNDNLHTLSAVISNDTMPWIEYSVFLGYAEIVLVIYALIRLPASRLKVALLITSLLFLSISLGKQDIFDWLWPYQYLFHILPYRAIIEPARFYPMLYIPLTLLVLMLLQEMKSKMLLLIVTMALIAERLPLEFQLSPDYGTEPFIAQVRKTDTSAVLDLPLFTGWWNGQLYDIYSVYYQRPIVNGYFHWSGDTAQTRSFLNQMTSYDCSPNIRQRSYSARLSDMVSSNDRALQNMRVHNIRTVVLHKDLLGYQECDPARSHILALLNDTKSWDKVYEDSSKLVLWLKR